MAPGRDLPPAFRRRPTPAAWSTRHPTGGDRHGTPQIRGDVRVPRRHVSARGDPHDQLAALLHVVVRQQREWRRLAGAMTDGAVVVDDRRDVSREGRRVGGLRTSVARCRRARRGSPALRRHCATTRAMPPIEARSASPPSPRLRRVSPKRAIFVDARGGGRRTLRTISSWFLNDTADRIRLRLHDGPAGQRLRRARA